MTSFSPLVLGGLVLAGVALACGTAGPRAVTMAEPPTVAVQRTFACGPSLTCDASRQYCSVMTGGPVGVPPAYQCVDLPPACLPNPSCGCLPEVIGCTCSAAERRLTVTCSSP